LVRTVRAVYRYATKQDPPSFNRHIVQAEQHSKKEQSIPIKKRPRLTPQQAGEKAKLFYTLMQKTKGPLIFSRE